MASPAHLHTDTLRVQRYIGRNPDGGDPIFGTEIEEVAGLVEPHVKITGSERGKKRASSHRAQSMVLIKPNDRVWIVGKDPEDEDQQVEVIESTQAGPPDKHFTLWEYLLGE